MHRPSKNILGADLEIRGIINSYSSLFFENFKYISDSRRRWRENIDEIIDSDKYERLHILTHAFWYNEEEKSLNESVNEFINGANVDRYHTMMTNITDLESIMKEEELYSGK